MVGYHRATSLADALLQLKRQGAYVYAGGTDLLVALREQSPWIAAVRHLVDIKGITELRGIARRSGLLRIGALTTAADLARSRVVRRHALVLAEAAAQTSAPWIRARGTVGGNLLTPHPAGDMATALVALGASVEFIGSGGRLTVLDAGELLASRRQVSRTSVLLAVHVPTTEHSAYERVGRRSAFCRATAAVGVAETAQGLRVAVAGLGERPFLLASVDLAGHAQEELVRALVSRARQRAQGAQKAAEAGTV